MFFIVPFLQIGSLSKYLDNHTCYDRIICYFPTHLFVAIVYLAAKITFKNLSWRF